MAEVGHVILEGQLRINRSIKAKGLHVGLSLRKLSNRKPV